MHLYKQDDPIFEEDEKIIQRIPYWIGNLFINEIKQLEKWTNLKCSEIIFDTEKDDWSQNTSVFDSKIFFRKNLIIVIEDFENNKFGCFISSTIDQYDDYIQDKHAFIFTLKNNGRIKEGNGMKKFDISNCHYGFYLCTKQDNCLFWFGHGDITMGTRTGSPF